MSGIHISAFQRGIGNLIVAATFLLITTVLALNLQYLPPAPANLWLIGPTVALTVAATLSLAYNRSRIFLACCLLAFTLWFKEQHADTQWVEFIVAGIVPVNLLLIAFLRERGALTFRGFVRLALITGELAFILYLINTQGALNPDWLAPIGGTFADVLAISPFQQSITLLLLVVAVSFIIVVGLDESPISQGLATALACLLAGYCLSGERTWELFIMAGAVYLIGSLIRDSYNMAYRDELTGLPHRRALNEQFHALGSRYALAMLDVDHFKKFNDTHGHDVGDQVLQMVAAKIRQVSGGGKAYRYGGEEFSVVFPRLRSEDAFYYLDEVRKTIQNYEMVIREDPRQDDLDAKNAKNAKKQRQRGSFRTASKKVSVTISIGVADRVTIPGTPEDVLKAADEALYRAKKAGRNQVSL